MWWMTAKRRCFMTTGAAGAVRVVGLPTAAAPLARQVDRRPGRYRPDGGDGGAARSTRLVPVHGVDREIGERAAEDPDLDAVAPVMSEPDRPDAGPAVATTVGSFVGLGGVGRPRRPAVRRPGADTGRSGGRARSTTSSPIACACRPGRWRSIPPGGTAHGRSCPVPRTAAPGPVSLIVRATRCPGPGAAETSGRPKSNAHEAKTAGSAKARRANLRRCELSIDVSRDQRCHDVVARQASGLKRSLCQLRRPGSRSSLTRPQRGLPCPMPQRRCESPSMRHRCSTPAPVWVASPTRS